jgi:phosphatidylserine/phosphatidylglycerophosphate/cardiolipin synthase-like enzyme
VSPLIGLLLWTLLTGAQASQQQVSQQGYPWSRKKLPKVEHLNLNIQQVELPKDNEVCFSPEEPCDLKLIKLIQSAKNSIDIAIYDINLDALVHELLVASKRIPVRVLVDRRQAQGEHSLVPLLIQAGAQLRFGHQRGIMHNKFTIIDGKILETGSFNYTRHASQANNENQIYLENPTILQKYKTRFDTLWNSGTLPKPTS